MTMKTHLFGMAVAAAALLAATNPAEALVREGAYVGGGAGATFTRNAETEFSGGQNKLEYDPGWLLDGSVGYGFGNGVRTELEFGYRRSSIDNIKGIGAGPGSNGRLTVFNVMGNALYDLDLTRWMGKWGDLSVMGWRLNPYIGAGIGYAHFDADNIRNVINGSSIDDSNGNFAYQGIAGFSVDLDYNWAVTADYRYLGALDTKLETNTGAKAKTEYDSHNILFGVRYTFGEPTPVAEPMPTPAPAPAPVAQPMVPAVPQTYMVFFDWNQSTLTPEAQRILATMAADYRKGQPVRVNVTGHADTSGPTAYNQKLSMRRAQAVRDELVRNGVPDGNIGVRGAGEKELLVPTADGVREAQNRRAEIVMDGPVMTQ